MKHAFAFYRSLPRPMGTRRLRPLTLALITIASAACPSVGDSQETGISTEPAIAPIEARWRVQRDRLAATSTAIVKYRITSRPPSEATTEAGFRRLWNRHDLTDSKQLDTVAKMLDTTLDAASPGYTQTTLTIDVAAYRVDVSHGGKIASTIRHNGSEVWIRPHSNQVHVYAAGQSSVRRNAAS